MSRQHRTWILTAALGLLTAAPAPAHALSGMAMRALCAQPTAGSGDAAAAAAARKAGDAAFALRAKVPQAKAAIAAYTKSLAADGKQADVHLRLARVHYLLGDGHFRFEEEDDAQLDAFLQGANHAAAALALVNPGLQRKVCAGAPLDDVLATIDAPSVGPLYWFATHLGKYGLAKNLLEVLANKDLIFGTMQTLKRIAPTYFHHAPDRYLGAYYTKVPFPKGDLPRSLSHYQQSMRGQRGYFATYVLTAQLYVLKVKSRVAANAKYCKVDSPTLANPLAEHPCRRLYRVLLEHVTKAPNTLPGLAAEQAVEREKAKRLLEEIDTYFPKT